MAIDPLNALARRMGKEPPLLAAETFPELILEETADWLILNKPGWIVCHPSKRGPWSSLVGAAREYTGLERLHLVARLDRETSGLVVLAKHPQAARRLQGALQEGYVDKGYLAVLCGELPARREVSLPLGPQEGGRVHVKQIIRRDGGGQKAQTSFIPLHTARGFSLVLVLPFTGRKHQIRAHALAIGFPVAGDKLYGPDEGHYLDFIEHGWTDRQAAQLPIARQALHCWRMAFPRDVLPETLEAPLAEELSALAHESMGLEPSALEAILTRARGRIA